MKADFLYNAAEMDIYMYAWIVIWQATDYK